MPAGLVVNGGPSDGVLHVVSDGVADGEDQAPLESDSEQLADLSNKKKQNGTDISRTN